MRKVQRGHHRSLGWLAPALLGVVLLVIGGSTVYDFVYEWSRSKSAAKKPHLVTSTESEVASSKRRVVHLQQLPRIEATQAVAPVPADVPAAALPAEPELENAESENKEAPFLEVKQEPRDPLWAREMESTVRDALGALRDKQIALQNIECASIRCTLEGTIGAGGRLEEVVNAVTKSGLTRGRFKRALDDQGTTTFTAVYARKGYNLDGSPKAATAEAL
jgi:hypothetical protein